MIFIMKGFRTIVFIFIIISTTFRSICPPAFFRSLSNSGTFTELRPPTEFNMIKNCVHSIPCSCGKIYKDEIGRPLKVRLEEHRKAVVRGEIEKSGMADHIWKEKGNYLPLWKEAEIIDMAEHWRIKRLKESAHMLGYNDLLNRPSIELNTIWKPIIETARWKKKKNRNMITGKKNYT